MSQSQIAIIVFCTLLCIGLLIADKLLDDDEPPPGQTEANVPIAIPTQVVESTTASAQSSPTSKSTATSPSILADLSLSPQSPLTITQGSVKNTSPNSGTIVIPKDVQLEAIVYRPAFEKAVKEYFDGDYKAMRASYTVTTAELVAYLKTIEVPIKRVGNLNDGPHLVAEKEQWVFYEMERGSIFADSIVYLPTYDDALTYLATQLAWSPDGMQLVSVDEKGATRLWDIER